VEVEAARIEDAVALVAGDYCGSASVEGVAGTGTARVVHKAVATWIEDKVAVDVAAARVIYEGVASIRIADSIVLRIDTVVVEWAASGIENDVETDTVSYKIRKRTVAAVGVVACSSVVIVAVWWDAFMLVVELVAAWVEHKVAVTEITVDTVDAEAVITCAMSGVAVVGGVVVVGGVIVVIVLLVYGVVVNAVGFAVSVAVKNLRLLWLCHWCSVTVIHPRSVGVFVCSVALRLCFGSLWFWFGGFW
jgi:hypothetical protein